MSKPKILFRADGDANIGLGHVYRSLALAEMLSARFMPLFAIRKPLPEIKSMLSELCEVIELPADGDFTHEAEVLSETARLHEAFCVVLDGYRFDTTYQQIIRNNSGRRLVCIDDIHAFHFVADAIVNHAGGITPSSYSAAYYTRFYLGPEYSILGKPFRDAASERTSVTPKDDQNILICIGGADPDNITLSVLASCLKKEPKKKYNVVTGAAYKHLDRLQQYVNSLDAEVTLLSSISSSEMVRLMKKCGIAICSPSGVSYEYLSVGGELYLKKSADNQNDLMNYLIDRGLAFSFEDFRRSDAAVVRNSFQLQQNEFDGKSDIRLQKLFSSLFYKYSSMIRSVSKADLQLLFEWVNDEASRRQGFSTHQVTLEEHKSWFLSKLNDPNAYLYILETEATPSGQVRFDVNDEAVISYAIAKRFRGFGLGIEILQKGIIAFLKDSDYHGWISGYVKRENESSRSIFKRLGFIEKFCPERGQDVLKYSKYYE